MFECLYVCVYVCVYAFVDDFIFVCIGKTVHVQYARHWCGNPKGVASKKNTCLSAKNSSHTGH